MKNFIRSLFNAKFWGYGLFWSWNIIFLTFMLFGFAPQMVPEMITAVQLEEIPLAFLVYAVLLTLIPVAAVTLGATLFRRSPGRLFALGYGIEGPLMLLIALRFFAIRQMIAAVALLLTIAALGLATHLWQILDRRIDSRGSLLTHLRVIGLTFLLLTGLYAGLWLAFYAVPLAVLMGGGLLDFLAELPRILDNFWQVLLDFTWQDFLELGWSWIPFSVLGLTLALYTATLFVLMPVAVMALYSRAWREGFAALSKMTGRGRAIALTLGVAALCIGLAVQLNQQPQHRAFALLKVPPASVAEARKLLSQQDDIRRGLLNSYLAPQRYLSAVGEVRHVSDMYESGLNLDGLQAARVQQWYELIARPLLYQPITPREPTAGRWGNQALRQEPMEAAALYQNFFDQPIIEAEKEIIVDAVRSTWSIDQAQAGWQAVDDREVYLLRQELTVAEHGDWANVELFEVYQNRTGQRQEVVYYFSLPESAVMTGLWLGNSPERAERFAYRVSPRGAAQELYRSEVRRRQDPALLEQIGPRQYRLRIFPVEPQTRQWDDNERTSAIKQGPPLYLWLTYRALAQEQNWPLPHLAEKRNVFWNKDSVRLINGDPMSVEADTWLPEHVPAVSAVEPVAHYAQFAKGQTVRLEPISPDNLPTLPADIRLAVTLDRSRSMATRATEIEVVLNRLVEMAANGATVELYLTASKYRGESPTRISLGEFESDNILYFGGQNAAELLAQFDTLSEGEVYDAVLVLTDGSGYELGYDGTEVPVPNQPVWLVHLGGEFPLGYDDATLEAIQASGGGIAGSVAEAFTRLASSLKNQTGSDIIDGYRWLSNETAAAGDVVHAADDDFTAIAARRLILAEMYRLKGKLVNPEALDQLHAIAVEQSVVTPYSSMIVLVNEQQQNRLDELENRNDRFEREHEQIGETNPINVTGVPEPEEWLLIGLATAMLAWAWHRNRGVAHLPSGG